MVDIKEWRQEFGITQQAMAMAMASGLDVRWIQKAEAGDRVFFVKHFSLKKASDFPVFSKGFSLL